MNADRKPGFYWVRVKASFAKLAWNTDEEQEWMPAEYMGNRRWDLIGSDEGFREDELDIGEEIVR